MFAEKDDAYRIEGETGLHIDFFHTLENNILHRTCIKCRESIIHSPINKGV
jgi:hypothetical protein